MEKYPLIKVRKGKVMKDDTIIKKNVIEFIENLVKEYGIVYIMDVDGYKKNSANIQLYKKLRHIWVDSFPRYVEDVMDLIIIGVEKITVRNMEKKMLDELKNMTDHEIYLSGEDIDNISKLAKEYGFKGIVLHEWQESKDEIETWKIYPKEYVIRRIK